MYLNIEFTKHPHVKHFTNEDKYFLKFSYSFDNIKLGLFKSDKKLIS